jgi:hypothetical protein
MNFFLLIEQIVDSHGKPWENKPPNLTKEGKCQPYNVLILHEFNKIPMAMVHWRCLGGASLKTHIFFQMLSFFAYLSFCLQNGFTYLYSIINLNTIS